MAAQAQAHPETAAPKRGLRRYALPLLRAAVTVGAIVFVASKVDGPKLLAALMQIAPSAWLLTMLLFFIGLGLGAQRWRLLLDAFGAPQAPSVRQLFRIHLVGFFYSTCVPGGVGGDIVRAVATRNAFGPSGGTGSLAVVLVERVLGMTGLLLLAAGATLVHPLPDMTGIELGAALGLAGAMAVLVAVANAQRLAPLLPGALRRFALAIPVPRRYSLLVVVTFIAMLCHACVACGGHALLHSIAPGLPLTQSLVIIPVAAATAFLPFTVAGIGVREAAFVALYARAGVAEHDALAVSFGVLACTYALALLGGLLELVAPVKLTAEPEVTPEPP